MYKLEAVKQTSISGAVSYAPIAMIAATGVLAGVAAIGISSVETTASGDVSNVRFLNPYITASNSIKKAGARVEVGSFAGMNESNTPQKIAQIIRPKKSSFV